MKSVGQAPSGTVAEHPQRADKTKGLEPWVAALLEPKPTVRFQGRDWNKWIEVLHLDGFSGHADKDDFVAYLAPMAGKVRKARLIHGEREQAEALAGTLRGLGFADVAVPAPGDRVVIG